MPTNSLSSFNILSLLKLDWSANCKQWLNRVKNQGLTSWLPLNLNILINACSTAHLCLTVQPHGLQPTKLLCPWDYPSKNTGIGCHILLQGILINVLGHNGKNYYKKEYTYKIFEIYNIYKCKYILIYK